MFLSACHPTYSNKSNQAKDVMTNSFSLEHDHTNRLCLRSPIWEDLDTITALTGDPRTNAHNPFGPPSPNESADMLKKWMQHWSAGLGYWCVRLIDDIDKKVIGIGGLRPANESELNLYYRFAPDSWGQGLATELAQHAIKRASQHFPEYTVVALVRPTNHASIAVAHHAGLFEDSYITDEGGRQLRLIRPALT
ncbi:GNAT family N-acetyltransferase [Actinopolyspora sp. H202]|uniref:GNAT family N-acetyltransferase n=1 Tax=Actinopolyspora sp. H202 TaxID=1500456 RepID=UPI003EE6AF17